MFYDIMLIGGYFIVSIVLLSVISEQTVTKKRTRRYLLFTPATQWGVFATVSIPLPSEKYVSVAWFYEANYFTVDNATYFEPLLGDIETVSRNREDRSIKVPKEVMTRSSIYTFIESMLEKPSELSMGRNDVDRSWYILDGYLTILSHGYPGRPCLHRLICENAHSHFLHNGLMGDLIYLVLTPSASMSEDGIADSFYEAEYYGMDKKCKRYTKNCPSNLLEIISLRADNFV